MNIYCELFAIVVLIVFITVVNIIKGSDDKPPTSDAGWGH